MNHSYFRDRISAYHDRELTPYEEKAIREHLVECEECRNLLAELEKLDKLVDEHSELEGKDYWEQSAQRIESQLDVESSINKTPATKHTPWWGLGWKITAAAASIAVLTFIGFHHSDIYDSLETAPPQRKKVESVSSPEITTKDKMPAPVAQRLDSINDKEKSTQQEQPNTLQKEVQIQPTSPSLEKQKVTETQQTTPEKIESKPDKLPLNTINEISTESETIEISKDLEEISKDEKITFSSKEKEPVYQTKTSPPTKDISTVGKPDIGASKSSTSKMTSTEPGLAMSINPNRSKTKATPQEASKADEAHQKLKELDLDDWLNRRDSLEIRQKKLSQKEQKLSISQGVEKNLTSADWVERQLLESYYNIAHLAKEENREEYDKAIESLREYVRDSSSRHLRVARDYLQRLGIECK